MMREQCMSEKDYFSASLQLISAENAKAVEL